MDDLISRQAAINDLNDKFHGMISDESMKIYQIINWLSDLPPAHPDFDAYCDRLWKNAYERGKKDAQPGWIPWDSGRFPEDSGTYTVTAYDGATKRVTYAKYQKRLKRWELTGARAYWRVLAWMEMPKPWKGEQP